MAEEIKAADVLVAGGGVVGCSVARALVGEGRRVTVVDPGRQERAATWAAGGMLSPLGEAPEPGPFLELALRSRELWPAFAAGIEAETGVDLGLALSGKLLVAFDREGADALDRRRAWQEAAGFDVTSLEPGQVGRLEPAVSGDVRAGLLLPRDGAVDNRALGRALEAAARAAGCRFLTGAAVAAVRVEAGRVTGARLDDGSEVGAGAVVVAAGAWSGGIGGLPRPLPVRPVRGQMLAYGLAEPLLHRVVAGGVYLIPRREGGEPRLLVGATQEEAGFERRTTPEALERLRAGARRLVPSLADAPVVEAWAGLRPGTPDDLPVLGRDPDVEGLVYATGHFRNGILLAPVTAEVVKGLLRGDDRPGLAPFRPDRFDGSEESRSVATAG